MIEKQIITTCNKLLSKHSFNIGTQFERVGHRVKCKDQEFARQYVPTFLSINTILY